MPTSPKATAEPTLADLRVPFPPEQIGTLDRGRGVRLSYVGHADTTDRLLNVDPAWTWEPVAFGPDGLPAFDKAGGLWIRLTVLGVTRLGYGDAQGKTGPNAVKEAIGDGIRNAAMRFGVALDLWAKGDREFGEQEPVQGNAPRTAEQRAAAPRPVHNVQRIHVALQSLDAAAKADVVAMTREQFGPDWTPANATDEQAEAVVSMAASYAVRADEAQQGEPGPT